ncbi:MAG TPA: copper-containing nitrite reductase [Anaerolineales bacterium]|nr:copper-containing nitrite reductase [Anaerolineales bacterium]HMX72732.1 copper-containing nitrite reductase [Anaerolineales bacterium]HNH78274.1 copper-containing nitrite reductase [Anaerolineales bacterium]HNJ15083.1 copper-containing nitrite reductase [Anaerolineales bacterium]HUM24661.1 copper-containing nitrite reductase [Anaerolineales bacterium]
MKTFLKFLAAAIFLGILVSACTGTSFQPVDKEYVLTTDLREGRLVFLGVSDEINGLENPTLSARPGSIITVTLINGGEGQHNLTFPEVQASTAVLTEKGEEASVTFTVPNTHGEMEYYDDVANHAELGMRGKLMVSETDQPMPVAAEQSNGDPQVLAAFQKGACGSCHAIDGIPNAVGVIAPNLSDINTAAEEHLKSDAYTGTATTTEEYIRESIADPNLFVAPTCPTGACAPNVMPATLKDALTEEEINSIVNYLSGLPEGAYSTSTEAAAPQAPTTGADVVRDPTDLPAPLAVREPQTVRVDLETIEVEGQLADGTTFTYWTFNGAVPGPFIRVRVGDTIEVHLKNSGSSTMNHSVDFHAVTGPGGGAAVTQTEPGKETTFTAKAINPGLYVYHCATPMVANHIANGMYGLILVEPEEGLPPVDREFYVMQGDIYTTGAYGDHGMQTTDVTKLLNEDPEYVVFNGAVGALTDQKPLKANVGETIRIFFGVGGPNLTSSFHVIGEIFDRVFDQASITSAPLTDVQTTLVPPGGATMVEFKLEVPGRFILVDHALSRLQRGLAGFLIVEGDPNPEIFDGTPAPGSGH